MAPLPVFAILALSPRFYGAKRPIGMIAGRLLSPSFSRMVVVRSLGLALLLWLAAAGSVARAQSLAPEEREKIDRLIARIAKRTDTTFIRNGKAYDAATAAVFLRKKWQANEAAVQSARDFIEKIGSFSSTSGTPYRIRLPDGRELQSGDFLLAELEEIESARENREDSRSQ